MNPLFPCDRLVGMIFWSSASNCLCSSSSEGVASHTHSRVTQPAWPVHSLITSSYQYCNKLQPTLYHKHSIKSCPTPHSPHHRTEHWYNYDVISYSLARVSSLRVFTSLRRTINTKIVKENLFKVKCTASSYTSPQICCMCLWLCPSVCPSVCLSVCLSVCPSVRMSVC